jgi:DNA-binding response OmpR family regulator
MSSVLSSLAEIDAYARAMSAGPLLPHARRSVLVADDDDAVRDVIASGLEVAGYRTLTVDNGRGALAAAAEQRPSAIVLDLGVPQLDGLSVCRELRGDRRTAEIPVLILSGGHRPGFADECFAAGADDFLPKPFSPAELLRRVNWLLMSTGTPAQPVAGVTAGGRRL